MSESFVLYYLHGFNSSPDSVKAKLTADFLKQQSIAVAYEVPHLPNAFEQTIERLDAIFANKLPQEVGLIGSSLGGFYATYLVERYGFSAVLVNPAVYAYELLKPLLGPNENIYTGERYILRQEDLDALTGIYQKQITRPQNYLVLLQTGDEVLDYRKAQDYYAGCPLEVEEGGSHGFDNYQDKLPMILRHFGIDSSA